jgi:hypothetical protein
MAKARKIEPCRVYVDPKVPRGHADFPPEFFESTGLKPGHHVVLSNKDLKVKEKTRVNEMLRACEIAVSPHLALYLGIEGAQTINVDDRDSIGANLFDDVEEFVEVLRKSSDHLGDHLREDVARMKGKTVGQVLDTVIADPKHPAHSYLIVPPNPPGFGIPRGEVCEDPSVTEKVWQPDDGTGKVKLFRPEGDGTEVEPDE